MANANQIGTELSAFTDKVLRATALDVQGQMKKMTPVDEGTLRSAVTMSDAQSLSGEKEINVSNHLPYAKRVYLEGHSKQLPAGEFQAFVASIPTRMEAIARNYR